MFLLLRGNAFVDANTGEDDHGQHKVVDRKKRPCMHVIDMGRYLHNNQNKCSSIGTEEGAITEWSTVHDGKFFLT